MRVAVGVGALTRGQPSQDPPAGAVQPERQREGAGSDEPLVKGRDTWLLLCPREPPLAPTQATRATQALVV